MKLMKRKNIGYLFLVTAIMIPFQNCSPFHASRVGSTDSSSFLGANAELRFYKAREVLQNKCGSCHSEGGMAVPLVLDNETLYVGKGLIVAGDPAASKLMARLKNNPDTTVPNRNMPMGGAALSDLEYETLKAWIFKMDTTAGPFNCSSTASLESQLRPSSMRRLTRRQYQNTLVDLVSRAVPKSTAQQIVGDALATVTLPADDDSTFSRFDSSIIEQHIKSYVDAADRLANALTTDANYANLVQKFVNLNPGTCTALNVSALSADCATRFINNFGLRALRRPVTEQAALMSAYMNGGGGRAGINAAVFRLLVSPHFLFQIEDRETPANPVGTILKLSSYSVASRLSYMFWNSMPDEELLRRASAQDLSGDAEFLSALTYVSSSAAAGDSIKEFMTEWLKLNQIPHFSTANPSLNYLAGGLQLDDSLRQAMIDEVGELGEFVYRSDLGFKDLFMSDVSFARDQRLVSIYGLNQAAPSVVTTTNAVHFPSAQRNGLLTRAALLISGTEIASPIKRGIRVRRELLCLNLENPPANLPNALNPPPPDVTMTTRERFDRQTSAAQCMDCHQHINPLGHSLGKFNAFGKFQTVEPTFDQNGNYSGMNLPINSSVDLSATLKPGLLVDSASSLSNIIATQASTQACFTEKFYRFSTGRHEDAEVEGCRLNTMYKHLTSSHTLKDFIKSSAMDLEFRYRKLEP